MIRLVLDTSSPSVSLGIWTEEGWMEVENHFDLPKQQSKVLFNLIKDLLRPFGIETKEITEIAVGQGPGSYTGLRMGITVAKVWAYAQKIPVYTFSSSQLLERTRLKNLEAKGPNIELLKSEDFILVENINELAPIYEKDHFSPQTTDL